MVLLKQVSGEEQLTSAAIHLCSFWVKIYDIPMKFRTERHLPLIAGRLGQFCEIDERGPVGWGKYIRARVVIDVDQPLKKEIHSRSATASIQFDSDDDQEFPYGEGLRASPTKVFIHKSPVLVSRKNPSIVVPSLSLHHNLLLALKLLILTPSAIKLPMPLTLTARPP
ncbi:hypothetical protein Tsubulata_044077 [Turnera subulata]|uniref:DUF4283 domain-containing protein n=1 Tax=Turnera subulata TaxID=218843 RepID=A0A9Q0FBU5_9ROSI|nr:hypothetical protein Tsubulata_044077 [Turnera subulata]